MSSSSKVLNPVVIGTAAVGKSALVVQFTKSQFITEYYPTVEEVYKKQAVIDRVPTIMDILDTGGQDEYSSTREQYMKTGEGFLCVFDLTSRESLDIVSKIMEEVLEVKGEIVPMVLAGNKADLEGREVSTSQGQALADKFACEYFETSALSKQNVEEAFFALVRAIRRKNAGQSPAVISRSNNNNGGTQARQLDAPKPKSKKCTIL